MDAAFVFANPIPAATLTKSGGSFALGDLRSYDAWGNVLTGGSGAGRPRGRYVANLGHALRCARDPHPALPLSLRSKGRDDESSLIYMRARYYEPASGRFISEDSAMDGANWYAYCANGPVKNADSNGKESIEQIYVLALVSAFFQAVGTFLGEVLATGSIKVDPRGIAAMFILPFLQAIYGKDLGEALSWKKSWPKAGENVSEGSFTGFGLGLVWGIIWTKGRAERRGAVLYRLLR